MGSDPTYPHLLLTFEEQKIKMIFPQKNTCLRGGVNENHP